MLPPNESIATGASPRAETLEKELERVRREADSIASMLGKARMCRSILETFAGSETRMAEKADNRVKFFRELLDNTGVLFFHYDLGGRKYLYTNHAVREFGLHRGDAILHDVSDAIRAGLHPEDGERVCRTFLAAMQRISRDRFSVMIEGRWLNRKNEYRWLYGKFTFIPDRSGTVASIMGSAVDITSQKEAEAELRESERRFRALTELCTDIFWILGPDWSIRYVSQGCLNFVGYSQEDVVRLPADTWIQNTILRKLKRLVGKMFEEDAASPGSSGYLTIVIPIGIRMEPGFGERRSSPFTGMTRGGFWASAGQRGTSRKESGSRRN